MKISQSSSRSVLNNAGWNAFGTLFNIIITFLLAPLLINRLGVDQWGLLLLVWSVAGVLGIANFGLGEATLRFVAHHHANGDLTGVNRVLGASITYYVLVCSAISTLLWINAPLFTLWIKIPADSDYPLVWLVRLTALLFSAGMIANAYRAIPMALHRYDISNKFGSIQGAARSIGLTLLVLANFGVVVLVIWDVLIACIGVVVQVLIARRLLPGIRWLPSMSLAGIREIIGYSIFSFLTHIFLMIYREGGKLLLGNRLGTSSVAFLGTPNTIADRLHMIVVSAIETLVPRFSASRDQEGSRNLLMIATWAAFVCGGALYVPLAVLMPDFLRLWISPDFAIQSGRVGQVLAVSLIGSIGYVPIAALFRGTGRPGLVTAVTAAVAVVTLGGSLLLVSCLGVLGVAYAYLMGALVWLGGLCFGWPRVYGAGSWATLMRVAGLPLALSSCLALLQMGFRNWWGEPGWIGLLTMGVAFAAIGAGLLVGCDLLLRGASPAALIIARVLGSPRMASLKAKLGSRQ